MKKVKLLKPVNPIVARRISLSIKKQKLLSILNSRSNSQVSSQVSDCLSRKDRSQSVSQLPLPIRPFAFSAVVPDM